MGTYKFKELIVWQRAIKFVIFIYELTAEFPKEEVNELSTMLTGLSANRKQGDIIAREFTVVR